MTLLVDKKGVIVKNKISSLVILIMAFYLRDDRRRIPLLKILTEQGNRAERAVERTAPRSQNRESVFVSQSLKPRPGNVIKGLILAFWA
jgi:hypothetical protein